MTAARTRHAAILTAARLNAELERGLGPMGDRVLRLLGGAIAIAAATVIVGSMFVGWYRGGGFCIDAPCGIAAATGWSALPHLQRGLFLTAALGGLLPAIAVWLPRRVCALLLLATALLGLGAALLAVVRGFQPPVEFLGRSAGVGPYLAAAGCLGVAGAAMLAGIGHRIFEPIRGPGPALAVLSCASAGIVVSLFLPWIRGAALVPRPLPATGPIPGAPPGPIPGPLPTPVLPRFTAWQAFATADVLLLLGAVVLILGAAVTYVLRWRASFLTLAAGGWLAAAIAVAATPHAAIFAGRPLLGGYGFGYYTCLGCAGAIVLAGLWVGLAGEAELLA